jgi:hypothetical protein
MLWRRQYFGRYIFKLTYMMVYITDAFIEQRVQMVKDATAKALRSRAATIKFLLDARIITVEEAEMLKKRKRKRNRGGTSSAVPGNGVSQL